VSGFSSESLRISGYIAVGLLAGMIAREFARAFMAAKLGDPTPRLWGRLTWNPRSWFEPFGSGLLPALILLLWAAASSFLPPPIAYAKPAPVDPNYLRRQPRDSLLVGFAGPLTNVAIGGAAGMASRAAGVGEVGVFLLVFQFANLTLAIFHLLPIPGLDGARLVALALPPRARETYRNLDQYLPLFVLLALFFLAGPIQSIVYSLVDAFCQAFSGTSCVPYR
jgi:Zn-dependent protease